MYALYRIITNDFSSVLIFSPPVLCHLLLWKGSQNTHQGDAVRTAVLALDVLEITSLA